MISNRDKFLYLAKAEAIVFARDIMPQLLYIFLGHKFKLVKKIQLIILLFCNNYNKLMHFWIQFISLPSTGSLRAVVISMGR